MKKNLIGIERIPFALVLVFCVSVILGCGGSHHDAARIEALTQALSSSDSNIQHRAILELAKLGRPAAPALKSLDRLADRAEGDQTISRLALAAMFIIDPRGKREVRHAFSMVIDPRVPTGLHTMTQIEDPDLQCTAIEALGWYYWMLLPQQDGGLVSTMMQNTTVKDDQTEATLDVISSALTSTNSAIRRSATVSTLTLVQRQHLLRGVARLVPQLEGILTNETDRITRQFALSLLGRTTEDDQVSREADEYWKQRFDDFLKYK